MARQQRIQYEDAWYHVINRGAGRRYILNNKNENKETFLELLEKIVKMYHIEIHAYCIMDNHYHLLVKTPNANLSEAIRYLQAMYTRIYNAKIDSDGPIFRGRFRSLLIETDSYLLQACRYIHLNPVEAGIYPGIQYQWSSFNQYISSEKSKTWLTTDYILDYYSSNQNYKYDFYNYHCDTDEYINSFYFHHQERNFVILNEKAFNEHKIICNRPTLEDLIKIILNYFSVNKEVFLNKCKGFVNTPLKIFIFIAIEIYKYKLKEVSAFIRVYSTNSISKIFNNYKLSLKNSVKNVFDSDIISIIDALPK